MIHFLRHGDAEDGSGDDSARELTAKGERQARAAGQALAAMGAEINACLASPKVRATRALLRPSDLADLADAGNSSY